VAHQFSFCVSGAILISFFSFSVFCQPHMASFRTPLTPLQRERSNSPRSVMLKTSACSELPLRFLGSSFFGDSSTRESTLESVFSVAAAIVMLG
jgi:hypothetical protein